MKVNFLQYLLVLSVEFHRSYSSVILSDAIIFNADTDLYEGSKCTTKNQTGICTLIKKCPRIYFNLSRNKQPPTACGFDGSNPLVCCINDPTDALPLFILGKLNTSVISNNNTDLENLFNNLTINDTFTGSPNLTENDIRSSTFEESRILINVGRRSAIKCSYYREATCPKPKRKYPPLRFSDANSNSTNEKVQFVSNTWWAIIGGELSMPKEFKGAAAVGSISGDGEFKWFCGGTLISENFILTAAHCLFNIQWGTATWVRVGDLNLMKEDDDAQPKNYKIIERIKHPKYNKNSLYHDIALLRLEEDVEFNDYVRPACVQYLKREYLTAHAIGWGKTDWADEEGSDNLLKVKISITPFTNCNQFYIDDANLKEGIIEEWQICAGDEGKDTCQGDSGGGLIAPGDGCLQDVIGVTSFGKFCGSIVPAIYTRVVNYIEWIENTVWPNVTDI